MGWYVVAVLAYVLSPMNVSADSEFLADYSVEYVISPKETTIVTNTISLTNALTNIYPRQYTIAYDTDQITNIIASDAKGFIKSEIKQDNGQTRITLPFNEKSIGIGRKMEFILRFENKDIARKIGSIWEINIPGIENAEEIRSYTASLVTPPDFGPPAYLWPQPGQGRKWTKEQMQQGGITAAFGTEQYYTVRLRYILTNDQAGTKVFNIALPPDTFHQRVSIMSIEPKPETILLDRDGNWLAKYAVSGNGGLSIDTELLVSVSAKGYADYPKTTIRKEDYLKPTYYWNAGDPRIVRLAQDHKTPRDIYAYVVNTLSYKYPKGQESPDRKGSLAALGNPQDAVCTEFTDLFVAIARAAGIPSRQVVGYAFTTNPKLRPLSLVRDVLHAWPEYYDDASKQWIPVDPTWTDTTGGVDYFDKLDFNHIAFAVNGIEDDAPLPAGSYNIPGDTQKLVDVAFADAQHLPLRSGHLTIDIGFPSFVTPFIPIKGNVTLHNVGGAGVKDVALSVSTPKYSVLKQTLPPLPPLHTLEVPFKLTSSSIFFPTKATLRVTVGEQDSSMTYTVLPVFMYAGLPACMILFLLLWKKIRISLKK